MICRRERFQTARPAKRRIRPSLVVHAVARHRPDITRDRRRALFRLAG
jgi:hypothetical protein